MATSEPTLFEQIGGEPSIRAAVNLFYEKVMADEDLAPFFEGVNMIKLKAHQRLFLMAATGAAVQYPGAEMGEAHAGMGITGRQFDTVVGYLVATLQELEVEQGVISQIGAAIAPLKDQIVDRSAAAR